MKKTALAVCLMVLLSGCMTLPHDFKVTDGNELTSDGASRFGVSIGMDRARARTALLKIRDMESTASSCAGMNDQWEKVPVKPADCAVGLEVDHYYMHRPIKDGFVALLIQDGKVVRIKWWDWASWWI